jgi:hypothetical protein
MANAAELIAMFTWVPYKGPVNVTRHPGRLRPSRFHLPRHRSA